MATIEVKKHKVKKGENLTAIAKKYNHKDWKDIWDAPDNKKLVKIRKEPENIEPGDELVIPLSDEEKKVVREQAMDLKQEHDAELYLQKAFFVEAARLKSEMKVSEALIKVIGESTQRIARELDAHVAGMKKWGEAVDVAKELATMGVNLGKLAATGAKASKAAGAALDQLSKQAVKDAADVVLDPLKNQAVKAAATLKNNKSWTAATIGILAESWDKMTSPSFWAQTYVEMTENRKSWSDAVSMEIGESIKTRKEELIRKNVAELGKLKQRRDAAQKRVTELERFLAEGKKRIQTNEADTAALPKF